MICTKCGREVPQGQNFCPVCGAALGAQQTQGQPYQNQGQPYQQGYQQPYQNQGQPYQQPYQNQGQPYQQGYQNQGQPYQQGYQQGYQNQGQPYQQGYQQGYQPQYQQPAQQGVSASVVLGIVAIVSAWLFAIVGHIVSIVGIIVGIIEVSKTGKYKGLILSIIGEFSAILNSLLGMLLFELLL